MFVEIWPVIGGLKNGGYSKPECPKSEKISKERKCVLSQEPSGGC